MDSSLYTPYQLSLERDPRIGQIDGHPPGTKYVSRKECSIAGVHTNTKSNVSGNANLGAFSIVVSSGYADNVDDGNTLVYTGTGGRSCVGSKVKLNDQTSRDLGNAALKKSAETQRPVRVIRGPNQESVYAPSDGYRYDGLYVVKKAEIAIGQSGYQICRFELSKLLDHMIHMDIEDRICTSEGSISSIIISGYYDDDGDYGSTIKYTGTGRRSKNRKLQDEDQDQNQRNNMYFMESYSTGKPFRVIRGSISSSKFRPRKGFRYDGLYRVVDYEYGMGKNKHEVGITFILRRDEGQGRVKARRGFVIG
ncbi:PUA-like domain-containing protein [Cyathus striatus]|nr:PUA-like domain-containing protein [Cyathus striatus]